MVIIAVVGVASFAILVVWTFCTELIRESVNINTNLIALADKIDRRPARVAAKVTALLTWPIWSSATIVAMVAAGIVAICSFYMTLIFKVVLRLYRVLRRSARYMVR